MTQTTELGAGLTAVVVRDGTTDRLTVSTPHHDTSLRFERVDGDVSGSLCYCGGRIAVDVTVQPGAMVLALDNVARELAVDPNRWRIAVARALIDWNGGPGWCPVDGSITAERLLLTVIGSVTHPLLEPVYRAGRAPLRETPRWALTVMRARSAAEAAAVLVDRPGRRLVRSLASSLLHGPDDGEPTLLPLAAAIAARRVLSGDELANVLDTVPFGVGEAGQSSPLASVDDVSLMRNVISLWPGERRAPLLADAIAHHRLPDIVTAFTRLQWVRHRIEQPLPMRLADLVTACDRHVPVVGGPATARRPTQPRTAPLRAAEPPAPGNAAPAVPAAPAAPARQQLRRAAPAQPVHLTGRTVDTVDAQWPVPEPLRAIHRHRLNGIVFDVATSTGELVVWGRVLRNCLGSYGLRASHGRVWLIGMWADDVLIGCIEVDPHRRRVVQIEGRANRQLNGALVSTAFEALHVCGVTRVA